MVMMTCDDGRQREQVDEHSADTVTHQRHVLPTAAECFDVLLNPAQSCSQIQQSIVARSFAVFARQKSCSQTVRDF